MRRRPNSIPYPHAPLCIRTEFRSDLYLRFRKINSTRMLEILIREPDDILTSHSYVQGWIVSHPEPGVHFTTYSLSVTLRGFSTTRVPALDGPEVEESPHESTVKFLERKQELYEQEVFDLPMDLDEGYRSSFWVPFPRDPAHTHVPELEWDSQYCDTVLPRHLPPSGRFGHGNEISYSVEASMLDLNSGKEIKASVPVVFTPTRDAKEAAAQGIELVRESRLRDVQQDTGFSAFCVAMRSPTVIVPGYPFPLDIRLALGTSSSLPTVLLKGGSVQLLEHTTAQSADNHSMTWHNTHTIVSHTPLPLEPHPSVPEITAKGLDIAPFLHHPTIPLHLMPSFECVNMQHSYGLTITLRFECGEQPHDLTFAIGRITLLPTEHYKFVHAKAEHEGWSLADCDIRPPFPDVVPFVYISRAPHELGEEAHEYFSTLAIQIQY